MRTDQRSNDCNSLHKLILSTVLTPWSEHSFENFYLTWFRFYVLERKLIVLFEKALRKYAKIPLTTKSNARNKLFTSNPNVTAIIDIRTAKSVSSFRNPNLSTIRNVNASTIVIVVPSHNGTLLMGNLVYERIQDIDVI